MRLLPALALALAAPAPTPLWAQDAPEPVTPASIVAAAPASDWRAIDPADLLVMTLAPDRDGHPRVVTIQLMPPPFSQGWVGNVRTLAKAHWWDGTSVYRVVDNWVAQWGDGEDDEAKAKPLPEGLRVVPESEYVTTRLFLPEIAAQSGLAWQYLAYVYLRNALTASNQELSPPAGFEEALEFGNIDELPEPEMPDFPDPFANISSHVLGWPIASTMTGSELPDYWPVHCYASVGVARDLSPDTGTGAELYAVIGHAPRQLDRNIAVVGRVIEGIEHLSTLPRGKGEAGVYDDAALRVPIVSVRLGNEVEQFPQPRFEYLASESDSFARYVEVRANRNDTFYKVGAGGVDVCNVQVPIRRVPSE